MQVGRRNTGGKALLGSLSIGMIMIVVLVMMMMVDEEDD
jgi:hypothetical protein